MKSCTKKESKIRSRTLYLELGDHNILSLTLSSVSSELLKEIKASWSTNANYNWIIDKLSLGEAQGRFSVKDGLLLCKGNMIVGRNVKLWNKILQLFHTSAMGFTRARQPPSVTSVLFYTGRGSRNRFGNSFVIVKFARRINMIGQHCQDCFSHSIYRRPSSATSPWTS